MIRSLSQIAAQHAYKLRSTAVVRDGAEARTLSGQPPIRVLIKRREDGGTTTKRIYAGE